MSPADRAVQTVDRVGALAAERRPQALRARLQSFLLLECHSSARSARDSRWQRSTAVGEMEYISSLETYSTLRTC